MTDDMFRQTRKRIEQEELDAGVPQHEVPHQPEQPTAMPSQAAPPAAAFGMPAENPLERIRQVQQAAQQEVDGGHDPFARLQGGDAPFQVTGKMPREFIEAVQARGGKMPEQAAPRQSPMNRPMQANPNIIAGGPLQGSDLQHLLDRLAPFSVWDPVTLPSCGKFYNSIPPTLHVRPMTGEEEEFFATPRYVKKGGAMNAILGKCIQENINVNELLTVDRNYLVIYLRGISYTPEYDVELRCPECYHVYPTVINLNALEVERCPDDFGPDNLSGVLPKSGFSFRYRLPRTTDEAELNRYKEMRAKEYGAEAEDDTHHYRTALLLESLEGITDKQQMNFLLKKLPVSDVVELRNIINDIPFGVDTEIGQTCPNCFKDFLIELEMGPSFFFPRKKKAKTHQ